MSDGPEVLQYAGIVGAFVGGLILSALGFRRARTKSIETAPISEKDLMQIRYEIENKIIIERRAVEERAEELAAKVAKDGIEARRYLYELMESTRQKVENRLNEIERNIAVLQSQKQHRP